MIEATSHWGLLWWACWSHTQPDLMCNISSHGVKHRREIPGMEQLVFWNHTVELIKWNKQNKHSLGLWSKVTFALANCILLEALGKVLEPHPYLRFLQLPGGGDQPCPLQLSPNKTASWVTVKPELLVGEPERWEGWNKGLNHGNHSSIVELDIRRKQTWSLRQPGLIKSKRGGIQQNPWVFLPVAPE